MQRAETKKCINNINHIYLKHTRKKKFSCAFKFFFLLVSNANSNSNSDLINMRRRKTKFEKGVAVAVEEFLPLQYEAGTTRPPSR